MRFAIYLTLDLLDDKPAKTGNLYLTQSRFTHRIGDVGKSRLQNSRCAWVWNLAKDVGVG
jgi:hypothetical protein